MPIYRLPTPLTRAATYAGAAARYYASLRYRRAARALSLRAALPVPNPGAPGYLRLRAATALTSAATRATAALYAYAALTGGPPAPPAYRYPARGPYRALTA